MGPPKGSRLPRRCSAARRGPRSETPLRQDLRARPPNLALYSSVGSCPFAAEDKGTIQLEILRPDKAETLRSRENSRSRHVQAAWVPTTDEGHDTNRSCHTRLET